MDTDDFDVQFHHIAKLIIAPISQILLEVTVCKHF